MKKTLLSIFTLVLLQTALFAQQAPDFTLTDCNGVTHHLYDDLAAGNAVILNFCAGWCGPCRDADPLLEEVYQGYCSGTGNVKVYGMLFEDNQQQITDCTFGQQYAANYGLTFPIFTNIGTWDIGLTGEYVDALGLFTIPTFYAIIPNTADPANSDVYWLVGYDPNLVEIFTTFLADFGYVAPPSISVSGDLETCSNGPYSATLTSNYASGNTWSTGETTQSITVHSTGTYTVTRNVGGCTSASKYIEFNPIPVAGTASVSSNTVCSGGKITLDYTPGTADDEFWQYNFLGDPNWYDFAPAPYGPIDVVFDGIPPGDVVNLRVRATNGSSNDASCISYSNEVQVTVNSDQPGTAPGTASASSNSVCFGAVYSVSYSGNVPGSFWQVYDQNGDRWINFPGPADHGPVGVLADSPLSNINGLPGDRFRVKIFSGNCYNLSNVVEVVYTMPEITVTVTPQNNVYTGGIPTNIYLGYGPQTVTLGATSNCPNFTGRYWDGPYLSCDYCDSPVFAPTEPGDYEVVSFVYNEFFDYTYQVINFCVRDVKVPGQNNKVYVCHNNNSLAVAKTAVPGHLTNHTGDKLGKCNQTCGGSGARPGDVEDRGFSGVEAESGMQVFPNPAQDEITVSFHAETAATFTLKVVNATGQTVLSAGSDAVEGDNTYRLSMKNLPSGMYFVALQSGETVMQQMIVRE